MKSNENTPGVALLCDESGVVRRVILDEIGMTKQGGVGRPLARLVARGSMGKALSFMAWLREEGAIFDWEMDAEVNGTVKTLHFGGGRVEDHYLIVGAASRNGVMQLYEELMKITNEQANSLRAAMKSEAESRSYAEQNVNIYDEITQQNNNLINLQRELTRKNAELERLNQDKNRFLGMAAHDLRNPLGQIMAFSEFLEMDLQDSLSEEQQEFLEIIQSTSRFMLSLVNDLLDISAIESGKLDLDLQLVNLIEVVEHNVMLNRSLATHKEIDLQFDHTGHKALVWIDRPKIQQVLDNLLSNAVKYSHPRTVVRVSLTSETERVLLAVQDQGQGIPADEIGKLFHHFQTTSVQSTGGEQSTGLGLAIARRIVQEHGGKIWVESEAGRGSTFFVSLPKGLPGQRVQ